MAKPPIREADTTPTDYAQVPPRDLHPTSDIRFVIVEVAKLTTLVERLIKDVEGQEKKIDDLRHQATFIKGGIAVAVIAVGVVGWLLTQAIEGKLQTVLTALSALK